MRVVLLTGKGGVGKTTLSAATAIGAAEHGHRVFLLSTDPAHSVGDALGRPVGARPGDFLHAELVHAAEYVRSHRFHGMLLTRFGRAVRPRCS
jgi:arsenite-transporting ATPase